MITVIKKLDTLKSYNLNNKFIKQKIIYTNCEHSLMLQKLKSKVSVRLIAIISIFVTILTLKLCTAYKINDIRKDNPPVVFVNSNQQINKSLNISEYSSVKIVNTDLKAKNINNVHCTDSIVIAHN